MIFKKYSSGANPPPTLGDTKFLKDLQFSLESKGLYMVLLALDLDSIDDEFLMKFCNISKKKLKKLLKEIASAEYLGFEYEYPEDEKRK